MYFLLPSSRSESLPINSGRRSAAADAAETAPVLKGENVAQRGCVVTKPMASVIAR
jgi:hypothetical protein